MEQHRAAAPWLIATAAILVLGLIAFFTVQTPAYAQQGQACGNFLQMREQLKSEYGEEEVSFGMAGPTSLVLLFASRDGKTWTLLALDPSGRACVIAGGRDWMQGLLPGVDA